MRWIGLAAAACAALAGAPPAAALVMLEPHCDAPVGAIETVICTDPQVKAADRQMIDAYSKAVGLMDPALSWPLGVNQNEWSDALNERCGETAQTDDARPACVLAEIKKRIAFLRATPQTGPGGNDTLLPYVFAQPHSAEQCAGKVEAFDFAGATATPGERAFNKSVHELIPALARSDFSRDPQNDPDDRCAFSIYDPAVTYASPELVSINLPSFFDDDAKDGHYDQTSVTTDLAAGKTLAFADVFPQSAKAPLIADCTRALRDQRVAGKGHQQGETEEPQGSDPPTPDWAAEVDKEMTGIYANSIAARVTDLRHWIVYADRAEVYFPEQSIGSNVEGNFACSFTNAQLAAYAGAKGWIVK